MAERYLSESSVLQAVGDIHPLDYNGQGIVERIKAIPAADVVERPRWIPVTERLPEREWVLCKCRAKIHEVLSLRDGYWYHDPQHQYMSGFVTHWMPLPEPPKDETPTGPYDLLYEEGGPDA